MAQNNLKSLSQAATVAVSTQASTAISAAPTSYGLTPLQATALAALLTAYNTNIAAWDAAEAALRSATQAKALAKASLTSNLADLAKIIYAFPGITDTLIAAAGLAIYATPGTVTPVTPTDLIANPKPTGAVALKWNRSGNPYGVTFAIEAKPEGGTYSVVAVTDASKFTLSGYTPGVATWFRVVAINRGLRSDPSLEVSIYHDAETFELEIAA